jgi:hypothetical protein
MLTARVIGKPLRLRDEVTVRATNITTNHVMYAKPEVNRKDSNFGPRGHGRRCSISTTAKVPQLRSLRDLQPALLDVCTPACDRERDDRSIHHEGWRRETTCRRGAITKQAASTDRLAADLRDDRIIRHVASSLDSQANSEARMTLPGVFV